MFCRYCGNEIPEKSKFCKICGKELSIEVSDNTPEESQRINDDGSSSLNEKAYCKYCGKEIPIGKKCCETCKKELSIEVSDNTPEESRQITDNKNENSKYEDGSSSSSKKAYCKYCGKEIPIGEKYCETCGKDTNIVEENVNISDSPDLPRKKKISFPTALGDKEKLYIVSFALVMVLFGCLIFGVKAMQKNKDKEFVESYSEASLDRDNGNDNEDKQVIDEKDADSTQVIAIEDNSADNGIESSIEYIEEGEITEAGDENDEDFEMGPYDDDMYSLSRELENSAKKSPTVKGEELYVDCNYDNGGYWFMITHALPKSMFQWYGDSSHYADDFYNGLKECAHAEAYWYSLQCEDFRRQKKMPNIPIHVTVDYEYEYYIYNDGGWDTYNKTAGQTIHSNEEKYSDMSDEMMYEDQNRCARDLYRIIWDLNNIPIANSSSDEQSMYVLPDSSLRAIDIRELYGLTKDECKIARNEIYARHGRKFKDEQLQAYFNSKPWYYGTIEADAFNEGVLNQIEKDNIKIISQYEKDMGYR